jgi:Transglycosylase SLT domain
MIRSLCLSLTLALPFGLAPVIRMALTLLSVLLTLSCPARATLSGDPAVLCEEAARIAAEETGVPLPVLRAIALTETGRRVRGGGDTLRPWPWATNQGGSGTWFASRDEAIAGAQATLDQGVTNLDIGCFQLNHRWHGAAFASLEDMFDPARNALYAAALLKGHFDRLGDWSAAAGAYHSGTPEYAERYRAKFDAIYAGPGDGTDPEAPQLALLEPRVNSFPLLRVGGKGSGASLFPATAAGRHLIGD